MIVTQAINVHLDKPSTPTIETVQSDSGRTVTAALFNQGAPWEPPAGAVGIVRYSILHNGEPYTSSYDTLSNGNLAVIFSGNQLTIHLSPEILSIPGVGELQVGILHQNVLVATMSVLLRVQRNIGTQGLTPKTYTDLSQHIQNELARQFRNVYDQGSWLDALHQRVLTEFYPGGIDDSGNPDPARTSFICSDVIWHGGRVVCVSFPAGVKARCLFYDAQSTCRSQTLFFQQSFTHYSSQPYMRLEVCYEDDGRIQDPQALASQIGIFYSHSLQGQVGALELRAFSECTDAGYYTFTQADLKNLSDAPDIYSGGVLEVLPYADTGVTFQKLWTSDGQLWFRRELEPFRLMNGDPGPVLEEGVYGVRTFEVDTGGSLHSVVFNHWLWEAQDGTDIRCKLLDDDGNYHYLPLTFIDYNGTYHFSRTEDGKRYTVKLTVGEDAEEEGEPQLEVLVEDAETGGGLTQEQIAALDGMFRIAAYTANASEAYAAFYSAFGLEPMPDVPAEPDEPDIPIGDNEPVYQLTEATTFNADRVIDTGYTLLDVEKSWSVCVDCTDSAGGGVVWDASPNGSQGLTLAHRGGYFRTLYLAGSIYKDLGNGAGNFKVIVTHQKNADRIAYHYVLPGGTEVLSGEITYTKYLTDTNIISPAISKSVKIGGNFDGTIPSYKGTVNRFAIYERVLTEDEIRSFMGVA